MPRRSDKKSKSLTDQGVETNLQREALVGELVEGSSAELSRRFSEVVGLFGTKRAAAKVIGRTDETLASYLGAVTRAPFGAVAKLAQAKGVSLDWLWTGEGPMRGGITQPSLPVDGFVYIPRYGDVRASAGSGQLVAGEGISDFLAFREDWVRFRLRRNPANLVVIEAVGDSMAPTIENGDIMLMDKAETRIRDSAIYVLASGDEAIVKRVERKFDGTIKIISDNPVYETVTVTAQQVPDLRVLGRVVWAGGLV